MRLAKLATSSQPLTTTEQVSAPKPMVPARRRGQGLESGFEVKRGDKPGPGSVSTALLDHARSTSALVQLVVQAYKTYCSRDTIHNGGGVLRLTYP